MFASMEPDLPGFHGHVWMNGGPWLVADRIDAQTWTGIAGDYQEKILPLTAWDTEISVGSGTGLVLSRDYDDSTVEVYRVSPSELLIIGVHSANDDVQAAEYLADARKTDDVTGQGGWTSVLGAWRFSSPPLLGTTAPSSRAPRSTAAYSTTERSW